MENKKGDATILSRVLVANLVLFIFLAMLLNMSLNLINRLFERYNDVIINQTVMAERSVNSEINVM